MTIDRRERVTAARVYKRFPQALDSLPRVESRGATVEPESAPTVEPYRRPLDAAPREDAEPRERSRFSAWQSPSARGWR